MTRQSFEHLATEIKSLCIHHERFDGVVRHIVSSLIMLQPGEVLALVGPSRVGKSRAVESALRDLLGPPASQEGKRTYVSLTAENAQASGEFSTRGFMLSALQAVDHPIYGIRACADGSHPHGMEALVARTAEAVLREAFESVLLHLGTKYIVIDEAHHVSYVRGGREVAAQILDSWKCLAHKTKTVVILVGSYQLVSLLGRVPHLVGRLRRPIEFGRYREDLIDDIKAFQGVLVNYSQLLPFERQGESLVAWGEYLFDGSMGCVGHLSSWIRAALAWMEGRGERFLTLRAFEQSAIVSAEFEALFAELIEGEELMKPVDRRELRGRQPQSPSTGETPVPRNKSLRKTKPFQRQTVRRPRGGRA